VSEPFDRIDPIDDIALRLPFRDLRHAESVGPRMRKIESLVEAYLIAERDLVAAVEATGSAVPLPDGRTVKVGAPSSTRCPVRGANGH
jgi:hypothetical protein